MSDDSRLGRSRPSGSRLFRIERRLLSAATRKALRFHGTAHRQKRRVPPPGALPDAMVIPEGAPPPQIHWIRYDGGEPVDREVSDPEELRGALSGEGVSWVSVRGFGDEDLLRRLGKIFDIHPLALADVVNVPQRPKIDSYGDRHLIVLRAAEVADGSVGLRQVSLVLGPHWVVTFEEGAGTVFDPVRLRARSDTGLLRRQGADFLAYALIDAVVDGFFPVLDHLGDTLEDLEEGAIARPEPQTLARIQSARRVLVLLERVQRQQRDAVMALAREGNAAFGDSVRPYLRDVQDHAIHVLDALETFREMAIGLMDIYLSSVNNRANDVMKTLTVMATVFIPLSFLTGVYGMNFADMPELRWRWGYPGFWGISVAVALALLAWFRHRGWLGAPASPQDGDA